MDTTFWVSFDTSIMKLPRKRATVVETARIVAVIDQY